MKIEVLYVISSLVRKTNFIIYNSTLEFGHSQNVASVYVYKRLAIYI